MWTKTDKSTYGLNKERKAVSMENMDEEGRKDALTGDDGKVVGRKKNKFPCWEIQNSTLVDGVGVSTDFNE